MEEPNRWLRGRWPRDHFTEGITYEHLTSFKPIDPERPDGWPLVNEDKQTRYDIEKLCRQFPNLQLHIPDYVTATPVDSVFIGYTKDKTLLYYDTYIDKTWNRYAALGIAPDRVPVYSIDEEWKNGKGTRETYLKNDALDVSLPYEFGNKWTNYLDVNTIYWDCDNETGRALVRTVLESLKRTYGQTRTITILKKHEFYFMNEETFKKLMQSSNPRNKITSYLKETNAWLFELEDMGFKLTYAKQFPFGSTSTTVSECIEEIVSKIFEMVQGEKRGAQNPLDYAYVIICQNFVGQGQYYIVTPCSNMFFVNQITTSFYDLIKLRQKKRENKKNFGKLYQIPDDLLDMIFGIKRYKPATLRLLLL